MRDTRSYERLLGAYEMAQRIAFPMLLGMAGWLATGHLDQENRLTRIESSRYTQADARADRDKADSERRDLERLLIRLEGKTSELVKAVNALEQSLRENR